MATRTGADKHNYDEICKRRTNYKMHADSYNREKAARLGHKGKYATHKVKGETLPGNLDWDLG